MAVNYAKQYSAELANAYPFVLYFGALWGSDKSYGYERTVFNADNNREAENIYDFAR